jgi:hypothetical protein
VINRVLIGLVLVGLVGCGSTPPTVRTPADNSVHFLVAAQGVVSVKREGWSAYAPALFGTTLHYGDLLRLDASAQATVVCADLTVANVPSGANGVPCKVAQPVLVYNGSLVNPTRSVPSGEFPLVVTPRKTKVLNPHPTLRWTPVGGATSYTVSVRGSNVNWSTTVTSGTEVVYPANAPALVSGSTYKVIVVAGNRSSEEETLPGLGFTVLKSDETTTVREGETKIRGLGLADAPTRLLLANLYATQGLTAEAVEQLEALSNTSQEPAVLRSLGDSYLTLGLNRLAEARYLHAVELSEHANDIEGQALAQRALGAIYEAIGNAGEAAQWLRKALELYQQLGDTQMVAEIEQQLAGLPKP